jgi:hypothetical protein
MISYFGISHAEEEFEVTNCDFNGKSNFDMPIGDIKNLE